MVRSVRDKLDLALPAIRASSSSEPGAFAAMTRSSSRLPADRTLAKDSVEANQTFRFVRRDAALSARYCHSARLHLAVAGDANSKGGHQITPISGSAASWYSHSRMLRSRSWAISPSPFLTQLSDRAHAV